MPKYVVLCESDPELREVLWETKGDPSLNEIQVAARKYFPSVPFTRLKITSGGKNFGRDYVKLVKKSSK